MYYEQLKEISAERLVKDQPNKGSLSRYLLEFGYSRINYLDNLKLFNRFIEHAVKNDWIWWLVHEGYIREVEEEIKPLKEEVFYHTGQKFVSGSQRCLLAQVAFHQAALIVLNGNDKGNRWRDPVEVYSCSHVTEEEFDKISNNKPFTLITETSTCL